MVTIVIVTMWLSVHMWVVGVNMDAEEAGVHALVVASTGVCQMVACEHRGPYVLVMPFSLVVVIFIVIP
jgi:hypothetical protein